MTKADSHRVWDALFCREIDKEGEHLVFVEVDYTPEVILYRSRP